MPPLSHSPSLEVDACSYLQLPFRLLAPRADRPEAEPRSCRIRSVRILDAVVYIAVRACELRRIKQVVRLRPKLELHSLRNRKVFEHPEVDHVISRAEELVPIYISCAQIIIPR